VRIEKTIGDKVYNFLLQLVDLYMELTNDRLTD